MPNSKPIDQAITEGVWAIVTSGNNKYIGQLHQVDAPNASKKDFRQWLGHPVSVAIAYAQEFHAAIIPQQVRHPDGSMGVALGRNLQAWPISCCLDIEKTIVHVIPTELVFFEDMSEQDRARHTKLILSGVRNALEQRAAESNIALPGRGRA